jgi:voltage-gated potassium channel Kch
MTDEAASSRRWTIALMAAGLGVFAMGVWGFRLRHAGDAHPPATIDLIYWSFQLFGLEWNDGGGPMPWRLQVARFAAPLITGAIVLEAVRMVTANVSRAFSVARLWRFRDHLVICGIGRKTTTLALAARRQDPHRPVVIIERDTTDPRLTICRRAGVLIHPGDPTDPDVLRAAGLLHARVLVALTKEDGTNIQIAERARALCQEGRRTPLRVLVHVVDDELCRLIQELELATGRRDGSGGVELSAFDIFDTGARVLLEAPPHPVPAAPRGHIVIIGVGGFGTTLAAQAASAWALRNPGRRLAITLLDHDSTRRRALEALHPELEWGWEIRQVDMDVTSGDFLTAGFLTWNGLEADVVYVCFDDDARAVATALSLQPRAHPRGIPIVVRRSEETGLASLLDPARGLHDFPLVERTCTAEILEQTLTERIARAFHEHAPGEPRVGWEQLNEGQREAFRRQGRELLPRLQAAGYRMVPFRASTDALTEVAGVGAEVPAALKRIGFALERAAPAVTAPPPTP